MASTGGGGKFFSFILFLPLLLLFFSPTDAAVFDIVNQCPYTIWPASLPGGGRRLDPGQTWSLYLSPGTSAGRIWGRTGCSFDGGGRGGCQTGDCGGALDCRLSGRPPTTLAEFTLNGGGGNDYYDVSVIDGFNLPMYFGPTAGGGCRGIRCDNAACPDAYHYPDQRATFSCPSGTNYRVVFCP